MKRFGLKVRYGIIVKSQITQRIQANEKSRRYSLYAIVNERKSFNVPVKYIQYSSILSLAAA